jgi:hypothetical protein
MANISLNLQVPNLSSGHIASFFFLKLTPGIKRSVQFLTIIGEASPVHRNDPIYINL